MVIVRGVNVHPSAVEQIVRNVGGIAEYRVRLGGKASMTEMSLLVEPSPDCEDEVGLKARISREFESALSLRVPVEIASIGSLPRFEMKAKRWLKVQD
jgi:phenylacetate-CoA ligase